MYPDHEWNCTGDINAMEGFFQNLKIIRPNSCFETPEGSFSLGVRNAIVMMMIAFITFKSSLVPLFEGL